MQKIRTISYLVVFLTTLIVAAPQAAGNKALPTNNWQNSFVRYVQQSVEQDNIPGLAIALIHGNDVILAQGFGLRNISTNAPVTQDTLFHIGSTQKSMTAMMIATLVDDGLFDWDTPIVEYVPLFRLSNSSSQNAVTMRHLLSMRGGIAGDAEEDMPERANAKDVFSTIANAPLLGRPGQEFSYSNLSSSAAGYLGVLASGGSIDNLYGGYAKLLQEKILDPIGMGTATIMRSEALKNPNYSQSYILNSQGQPVLSPSYDFDGDALAPSGSLKASAYEMGLYVATHLNNGIAPNGNRVVASMQLQATYRTYLEDYGMGWEVTDHEGIRIIMHNGSFDDFASVIGFLPEFNIGFVILVNSEEAGENITEDAPYELVELLMN